MKFVPGAMGQIDPIDPISIMFHSGPPLWGKKVAP